MTLRDALENAQAPEATQLKLSGQLLADQQDVTPNTSDRRSDRA